MAVLAAGCANVQTLPDTTLPPLHDAHWTPPAVALVAGSPSAAAPGHTTVHVGVQTRVIPWRCDGTLQWSMWAAVSNGAVPAASGGHTSPPLGAGMWNIDFDAAGVDGTWRSPAVTVTAGDARAVLPAGVVRAAPDCS